MTRDTQNMCVHSHVSPRGRCKELIVQCWGWARGVTTSECGLLFKVTLIHEGYPTLGVWDSINVHL